MFLNSCAVILKMNIGMNLQFFLTEEAFAFLHLHIYKVLPNFNYFGPNSVNLKQWNQIAFIACTLNNSMDIDFIRFF